MALSMQAETAFFARRPAHDAFIGPLFAYINDAINDDYINDAMAMVGAALKHEDPRFAEVAAACQRFARRLLERSDLAPGGFRSGGHELVLCFNGFWAFSTEHYELSAARLRAQLAEAQASVSLRQAEAALRPS